MAMVEVMGQDMVEVMNPDMVEVMEMDMVALETDTVVGMAEDTVVAAGMVEVGAMEADMVVEGTMVARTKKHYYISFSKCK